MRWVVGITLIFLGLGLGALTIWWLLNQMWAMDLQENNDE